MGLSILTSGLAFVGAANATDLIINGSFEEGPSVGWNGYFKLYNHSSHYFTGDPIPAEEDPGLKHSWRHGSAEGRYNSPCTQTVNLTDVVSAGDIDTGHGLFAFSAWLSSYGNPSENPEQPYLTLDFFNEGGGKEIGRAHV